MTISGSPPTEPSVTPPDLSWVARSDGEPRHAFRRADGAIGIRSLCGLRWSVLFGKQGSRECADCAGILRQVLAGRVTV